MKLTNSVITLLNGTLLSLFLGHAVLADSVSGERKPSTEEGSVNPSGKFTPSPGRLQVDAASAAESEKGGTMPVAVRKLDEDHFAVGEVVIDKKSRSLTFPAVVNIDSDTAVEYALVTDRGKIHEAVFSTPVTAIELHTAALLLGLKPSAGTVREDGSTEVPALASAKIEVSWRKNGPKDTRYPLEALILDKLSPSGESRGEGEPLTDGQWFYNGSRLMGPRFQANEEGSLIALIPDGAALVNNPRPNTGDDQRYRSNQKLLPSKNTPVKIVISPLAIEKQP